MIFLVYLLDIKKNIYGITCRLRLKIGFPEKNITFRENPTRLREHLTVDLSQRTCFSDFLWRKIQICTKRWTNLFSRLLFSSFFCFFDSFCIYVNSKLEKFNLLSFDIFTKVFVIKWRLFDCSASTFSKNKKRIYAEFDPYSMRTAIILIFT